MSSVRSAYNFQSAQPDVATPVDVKMLWQKNIPLKVVIFAWRLFQTRLSTKDNLLCRNVIDNNSCLRVSGCSSLKTTNHLFLHYSFFGSVWNCILHWVGLSMVAPFDVSDHYSQFFFLRQWLSGAKHFFKRHLACYSLGNMERKK